MSNTFFIGDLHFGHKNIITFSRTQFKTVEEHDETLIQNWNNTVTKNDTVWILGDLAFGVHNLRLYVPRLRGRLKLVLGNHDDPRISLYGDVGIHKLYGAAYFGKGILTHIPVHPNQFERFSFNIHGHLHKDVVTEYQKAREIPDERYICVSAEHTNLTPIAWDTIRKQYDL